MANGKYKVYYTEEELELDVENCRYDVLNIFIGEDKFSIEITADCRKLSTAAKRFSEGYKAAVADGVIPATLVEYLRSYHLETLVEDAREGDPLIPYEVNGIKKDFPTVYVDSFTTEKPDYSGNETLLKGSCEAAVKVAKANIKNLREEISELKADFDKKQAVVDELTGKKERGEYYYEPDLPRAVNIANLASDTLNSKKAELDEFKVALEKAETALTAIGKPVVEIVTVDDYATSDALLVETILLEVTAGSNSYKDLLDFDVFLGNMLITNRSHGDEGYAPHDIWQPSEHEWLMTFDAKVTGVSYSRLIAYAKARNISVYGKVTCEGFSSWQLIVERLETEAEQIGA